MYRRVPKIAALDGIRGLAIAAVVLFHFATRRWVPGGLFGVGLFFVLSGFLITPILGNQYERTGSVQLGDFLRRRAWRLLPALAALLVVFVAAAALFGHDSWFASNPFGPPHRPGLPVQWSNAVFGSVAGLGYFYNLLLAYSVPTPSPLGHLWTLSVEAQFYVLWAMAAGWLLRLGTKAITAATCALIAVSAVSPLLAWKHGAGQNWIYFDTTPRLQELFAGVLLAQLWTQGTFQRFRPQVIRVAGLAGAVAVGYLVFEVGDITFKYLGAETVVAFSSFFIIACLIDDRCGEIGRKLLGWRPLVWLGQRSYAVYLWHWPFAEWTNEMPSALGVPVGIGCSLLAAELSWRLVEYPAQKFAQRRQPAVVTTDAVASVRLRAGAVAGPSD